MASSSVGKGLRMALGIATTVLMLSQLIAVDARTHSLLRRAAQHSSHIGEFEVGYKWVKLHQPKGRGGQKFLDKDYVIVVAMEEDLANGRVDPQRQANVYYRVDSGGYITDLQVWVDGDDVHRNHAFKVDAVWVAVPKRFKNTQDSIEPAMELLSDLGVSLSMIYKRPSCVGVQGGWFSSRGSDSLASLYKYAAPFRVRADKPFEKTSVAAVLFWFMWGKTEPVLRKKVVKALEEVLGIEDFQLFPEDTELYTELQEDGLAEFWDFYGSQCHRWSGSYARANLGPGTADNRFSFMKMVMRENTTPAHCKEHLIRALLGNTKGVAMASTNSKILGLLVENRQVDNVNFDMFQDAHEFRRLTAEIMLNPARSRSMPIFWMREGREKNTWRQKFMTGCSSWPAEVREWMLNDNEGRAYINDVLIPDLETSTQFDCAMSNILGRSPRVLGHTTTRLKELMWPEDLWEKTSNPSKPWLRFWMVYLRVGFGQKVETIYTFLTSFDGLNPSAGSDQTSVDFAEKVGELIRPSEHWTFEDKKELFHFCAHKAVSSQAELAFGIANKMFEAFDSKETPEFLFTKSHLEAWIASKQDDNIKVNIVKSFFRRSNLAEAVLWKDVLAAINKLKGDTQATQTHEKLQAEAISSVFDRMENLATNENADFLKTLLSSLQKHTDLAASLFSAGDAIKAARYPKLLIEMVKSNVGDVESDCAEILMLRGLRREDPDTEPNYHQDNKADTHAFVATLSKDAQVKCLSKIGEHLLQRAKPSSDEAAKDLVGLIKASEEHAPQNWIHVLEESHSRKKELIVIVKNHMMHVDAQPTFVAAVTAQKFNAAVIIALAHGLSLQLEDLEKIVSSSSATKENKVDAVRSFLQQNYDSEVGKDAWKDLAVQLKNKDHQESGSIVRSVVEEFITKDKNDWLNALVTKFSTEVSALFGRRARKLALLRDMSELNKNLKELPNDGEKLSLADACFEDLREAIDEGEKWTEKAQRILEGEATMHYRHPCVAKFAHWAVTLEIATTKIEPAWFKDAGPAKEAFKMLKNQFGDKELEWSGFLGHLKEYPAAALLFSSMIMNEGNQVAIDQLKIELFDKVTGSDLDKWLIDKVTGSDLPIDSSSQEEKMKVLKRVFFPSNAEDKVDLWVSLMLKQRTFEAVKSAISSKVNHIDTAKEGDAVAESKFLFALLKKHGSAVKSLFESADLMKVAKDDELLVSMAMAEAGGHNDNDVCAEVILARTNFREKKQSKIIGTRDFLMAISDDPPKRVRSSCIIRFGELALAKCRDMQYEEPEAIIKGAITEVVRAAAEQNTHKEDGFWITLIQNGFNPKVLDQKLCQRIMKKAVDDDLFDIVSLLGSMDSSLLGMLGDASFSTLLNLKSDDEEKKTLLDEQKESVLKAVFSGDVDDNLWSRVVPLLEKKDTEIPRTRILEITSSEDDLSKQGQSLQRFLQYSPENFFPLFGQIVAKDNRADTLLIRDLPTVSKHHGLFMNLTELISKNDLWDSHLDVCASVLRSVSDDIAKAKEFSGMITDPNSRKECTKLYAADLDAKPKVKGTENMYELLPELVASLDKSAHYQSVVWAEIFQMERTETADPMDTLAVNFVNANAQSRSTLHLMLENAVNQGYLKAVQRIIDVSDEAKLALFDDKLAVKLLQKSHGNAADIFKLTMKLTQQDVDKLFKLTESSHMSSLQATTLLAWGKEADLWPSNTTVSKFEKKAIDSTKEWIQQFENVQKSKVEKNTKKSFCDAMKPLVAAGKPYLKQHMDLTVSQIDVIRKMCPEAGVYAAGLSDKFSLWLAKRSSMERSLIVTMVLIVSVLIIGVFAVPRLLPMLGQASAALIAAVDDVVTASDVGDVGEAEASSGSSLTIIIVVISVVLALVLAAVVCIVCRKRRAKRYNMGFAMQSTRDQHLKLQGKM